MNSEQTERVDWVELLDPESKKVIFANLESGEVLWEAPPNAKVRPLSDNQWWELYDVNTRRHYYHNAHTSETVWDRPSQGDVVPLSRFQLLKQSSQYADSLPDQDIGMMHRQKASRNAAAAAADGLTSRNSLLMGEPRQTAAAGWQSVSRPMPKLTPPQSQPQAAASPPHSAPPTAPPPPPHQLPQQPQRLPNDFEVHRRRNSQPSRSTSSSGQQQSQQQRHQHHHHSLTRNSFSGRSCPAPSSLGVANQRVTEWLRTAGALPEETEFENLDMSAAAVDSAGDPQACPRQQNVPDMARWSRNSGLSAPPGVTTTAAPHYPTVTHNSAYALQSPLSSAPATGGAVTYGRRIRPAVPVHAVAAAPKGQPVRLPEAPDNFSFSGPGAGSGGGGDAFSNLLYDTGCNVVYPRPPETQFNSPAAVTAFGPEQVEQALSGLNFGRNPAAPLPACHRTPQPSARNRNIPRTNPAFVGQTSNFTMPRLSAAAAGGVGAWPGNNRLSQQAPVGSAHLAAFPELGSVSAAAPPQPRSDQLNGVHKPIRDKGFVNGFQAAAAADTSSPDTELTNESASATDSDDQEMGEVVRDQQSDLLCTSRDDDLFESHARFSPVVDEYTFTVDRTGNLAGGGAPADPPPPVPPPRTASAEASVRSAPPPPHSPMDAASVGNRQSSLADDSSTWQSFASPTLGFLPRGHPFRQPTFRTTRQPGSADEEPILQDEIGQSISSRTQSTVSQDAITTSASVCSTGLQPRRSASGGFLGPTESESPAPPTGPPPSSLAPAVSCSSSSASMKPESGVIMSSASSNSATHFALISGPFSWPKELFRPGQDYTTLMFWTKSTFSKRLLSATDKNLQKIVSENFKLIQSFMGDRSAKMSRPDLASVIVHRGIATPSLRDELYAQLCKQTTGNYNADSLMRGWELLCLCLYFFPPNKVFRDPLRAYLAARCEALSIAEACAVSSGSGNVSACASETGTTNSDRLSAAGVQQPPPRPGPSLAAAAALAAGSDPALISATSITPIFGVPVSVLGKPGGGSGGGTVSSSTSAPSAAGGGGGAESVFYVDHSSGTPECQLVCPSTAVADFPYGPWVKLSALHFTRAAPRWFMRSIAVSSSRPQANISNAELLHVKDFLLKPCVFGGSLEEIMKIQGCRFPSLRLPWIQIFLTEELLRLNGAKAQGIFRLSTDLDTFTTVRFQLEKLFEVFRMVHVIPKDTGDRSSTLSSQSSNESPAAGAGAAAIGQYTILRPPPAGWSRSQLIFAPEAPVQQQQEEASPAYPLLLPCAKLTGSFSLPLRPTPIPERPSEYMLLTPRASWPADLAEAPDAGVSADGGTSASCPLDPHLAAGLLKLWIRELATPLIPPGLMAEVLAAANEAEAFELRAGAGAPPSSPAVKNNAGDGDGKPVTPIQACCALIRRLPPLSRRCLLYLIKLLQFLARPENSSVSLMDARNLATVIAPNLFRSSSTNASEMLNSVQSQTAFVRLLIAYLDVDAEADLLNAEPDADPVRPRFRSPPRARINADGILIPFR